MEVSLYFVFVQQSLQLKLSRRHYASVSYALQNNTVFRHAQNWVSVSDGIRKVWTRWLCPYPY